MKATHFITTLVLIASLASPAFALDSTRAVRPNVTPKSPVPTGTVATWPLDAAVPPGWLACNGQSVPSSYPELRALMAAVPNYNAKQFLRGSTSGAGRTVTDSTRSHTHEQPAHSHGFQLDLASRAVEGTASGQRYFDMKSGLGGIGTEKTRGSDDFKTHVDKIFPGAGFGAGYTTSLMGSTENSSSATATYNIRVPAKSIYSSMSGYADEHSASVSGYVNIPQVQAVMHDWNTQLIIDGGADYVADSALKNTALVSGSVSGLIHDSGGDTCLVL